MKTYNEIYIGAKKALRAAGIEAAELEARLLLAAAAEKTTAEFLRDLPLYPGAEFEVRGAEFLRRRLRGEPAAYIAGIWEFHGLELEVTPNVLIPRSDTEVITDEGIRFLRDRPGGRFLDLCTGTGCIGLALLDAVPDCRGVLADADRRALMVCRRNALRTGLGQRAVILEADALQPPSRRLGTFDLLISNPPYIPTREIPGLDASVRDYEPVFALDGGEDGLDFYRSIFASWPQLLKPGGCLLLECGETQAPALCRFGTEVGLPGGVCLKDTAGYDRAVRFILPDAPEQNETTASGPL